MADKFSASQFAQDQQLADFDRLLAEVDHWTQTAPAWPPLDRAKALWARVAPRLGEFKVQLDRLLVVGVVGGTGTGKSTLVNALVGQAVCAASDVQRPTTRHPTVLCREDVDPAFLDLEDCQPEVHRLSGGLIEHIILVDCPDPDTQAWEDSSSDARNGEGSLKSANSIIAANSLSSAGSDAEHSLVPSIGGFKGENRNREILRRVLPKCDVLICLGTAQKYKTQAVSQELLQYAPGRQIVFVQTHADMDPDIRDDWQKVLEGQGFHVPTIFRVDSQQALERQQREQLPSAEFERLVDLLRQELAARASLRIRRANALDMLDWLVKNMRTDADAGLEAVEQLSTAIDVERTRLFERLKRALMDQLTAHQHVWNSRLLRQVMLRWGGGPFASFLRLTGWLNVLVRMAPFTQARGLTPLVIAGGVGVGKALADRWREAMASGEWISAGELGIASTDLAQATSVLDGFADAAGIESRHSNRASSRTQWSEETLAALGRQIHARLEVAIEAAVQRRTARRAGAVFHGLLEILFVALPAVLIGKLGYNFFYQHLWLENKPLLGLDYLVQSLLWIILWGLLLRAWLVFRLRRGLNRDIRALIDQLAPHETLALLFDELAGRAEAIVRHVQLLAGLESQIDHLRRELEVASSGRLGRLER